MSILVTGGAGFIGSNFIEKLLRETNERIVCLDSYNDYYSPALKRQNVAGFAGDQRVTMIEGDFREPQTCLDIFRQHAVRQVVHLGAYAGVRNSIENPLIYQQTNVCGTLNLLEAARHHPVDRFLFASSSTVYGAGAHAPFVEDAPPGTPLSPYGVSKRAGELLCDTYHLLYDVPTVALRLFSVYGPRLRPDLAMTIFTGKIIAGEKLPLYGDGSVRRDFTHVDDIGAGLMAALSRDEAVGQAINLGHDQPIEIRQLIAMLESEIGARAQIDRQPEKQGDMSLTHADLSKARKLLGYEPKMPFDAGLREFVAWYRRTIQ